MDALRADESAAPTIVSLLDVGSMLTAVEFDRESSSGAVEVEDMGPQGMLSAKLEARQALPSDEHPQEPLGVGRMAPKGARELQESRIHGVNGGHRPSSAALASCC